MKGIEGVAVDESRKSKLSTVEAILSCLSPNASSPHPIPPTTREKGMKEGKDGVGGGGEEEEVGGWWKDGRR